MTYNEFELAYMMALCRGLAQPPQDGLFNVWMNRAANLADDYPEHLETFERFLESEWIILRRV